MGATKDVADIVIITGMSGSGRTQALHAFEDLGYFCIDNLPPRLILDLAKLVGINTGLSRHLAVCCDLRSQGLFDEMSDAIVQLRAHELSVSLLFLDASDSVLLRRYSESRRKHPIAFEGEALSEAIGRERAQLEPIKDLADLVINTSRMRTASLSAKIKREYSEISETELLDVRVFSFGFKHGMPIEADLMIDVRFLPNPFYEEELRTKTGNDLEVADYVLKREETQKFLEAWRQLLDTVMPGYVAEGKSQLSIAIGCTGGQHRSVVLANYTAEYLSEAGYKVSIAHRDMDLSKKQAISRMQGES